MDIYDYLKLDHEHVTQLFKQFEQSKLLERKEQIVVLIAQELLVHAHSEQETFYKTLKQFESTKDEAAYNRKDVLAWILIDNNIVGYFWFERKPDSIYISAIAIKKEFQGQGIGRYILQLADKYAVENNFSKCTLSVHPLNNPAINVYLKHNYIVVNAISSFFGPKHPDGFRLILEKALTISGKLQYSDKSYEVLCNDEDGLKNAIDNGYAEN